MLFIYFFLNYVHQYYFFSSFHYYFKKNQLQSYCYNLQIIIVMQYNSFTTKKSFKSRY